jgi:OOP family OmpA-OmpF porin
VDATGCAVDSDNDGVINATDKCPDTPAGTKVDAVGCPALFGGGASLVLQGVNFETGKAVLLPESQAILDRVATSLGDNPTVTVEVGGHTDNTGRQAANVRLSQARANTVRDYLISKGVDGARITAKGYGPDQPVADNAAEAGRAANRRVEFIIVDPPMVRAAEPVQAPVIIDRDPNKPAPRPRRSTAAPK